MADAHPRVYLLLAAACALAGYLWLLLFPLLALVSGYRAISAGAGTAGMQAVAWLVTGACALLVSYRISRFRPEPPPGDALEPSGYAALFRLVAEQSGHYRGVRIDRIVLSGDFGLEILETPRFALPVRTVNTLVIGLPLMQCLSEQQFHCLLARRLGQYSGRFNRLEHWLGRLRTIWPQYCHRRDARDYGYQPVAWFFALYAPAYRMLAAPAAQLDELAADSYAMELCTDEEVLDTICTEMVCQRFLAEKYWPVVREYAARNPGLTDKLHAGMMSVLRAGLTADALPQWLAKTLSTTQPCGSPLPSLARRIDNIGFGKASMQALAGRTAAGVYLVER